MDNVLLPDNSSDTPATPVAGTEALYPCITPGCEVMRTKAEGGTTFTICETCWPIHGPGATARRTLTESSGGSEARYTLEEMGSMLEDAADGMAIVGGSPKWLRDAANWFWYEAAKAFSNYDPFDSAWIGRAITRMAVARENFPDDGITVQGHEEGVWRDWNARDIGDDR